MDPYFNSNVHQMTEIFTAHVSSVQAQADGLGLKVTVPVSTITPFTTQLKQSSNQSHITPSNSLLPLEKRFHILGIIFDIHFTFYSHIDSVTMQASFRINILKAFAGTNWSQQKEIILITYKSLIQSIFIYTVPI